MSEIPDSNAKTAGIAAVRWWLKKASRRGLALAGSAATRLALARIVNGRPSLRILTYHRVGDAFRDPFCVSPNAFETQMKWLAHNGLAVSLERVQRFLAGEPALPRGAVLVTVDDGFRSLLSSALPILKSYGIPSVAFVPVGLIRSNGSVCELNDDAPEPRLSWDELAGVAKSGVVIGSHAWTHRSLGRMPLEQAHEEIARSRTVLERRLGREVYAFAYPYGTRADYTPATTDLLARCGYTCAFTSQHGAVRPGIDPMTLPRVKIEGGEPEWMFPLLCRGALDGWRWVDRTLWPLQARAS